MTAEFILTTIAIVAGPILAVLAADFVAERRKAHDRRMYVFRTLMQTRRNRLSFEHVGALNLVEIEFNKDQRVLDAFGSLLKYFEEDTPRREGETDEAFFRRKDDIHSNLLTKLLDEMSKRLGYRHSQLEILRGGYSPIAHGDIEMDQMKARKLISEIYDRERAIAVAVLDYRTFERPHGADEEESTQDA